MIYLLIGGMIIIFIFTILTFFRIDKDNKKFMDDFVNSRIELFDEDLEIYKSDVKVPKVKIRKRK